MGRVLLCALIALAALPATGLAGVDPDGRYAGKILGRDGKPGKTRITARVSKDGRRITKLKTTTVAFCIGARIEDNRFNVLSVFIRGSRSARTGA